MHEHAFFNCGSQHISELKLPAISSSSLFGKGIFTALAIHDGVPFLWEKHWRRLEENAAVVGIALAEFSDDRTRTALDELIVANSVQNGRARITFFDGSASGLWPYASECQTSLLVMTADFRATSKDLSLTVSPYRINSASPLTGVKSCNYLEKIMAMDEAKRRGADEAIQLNERGEIASACMANLFWLKGTELFTSSLKTGCLAGTTRGFTLENLECEEVEAGIEELRTADEIFLTSAGMGIIQVAEFDGRRLNRGPHLITNLLPRLR